MTLTFAQLATHLLAAVAAGGVIGVERSYHGRPAGFRTHTLVALASSALMLITVYQGVWFASSDTVRIDPTRMAQGIMTGIGFLGAGLIFKEGLTVRGLTTAASIWTTAAIGILMGTGLYGAGMATAALTLGVLSFFRWIEKLLPVNTYAEVVLRFARASGASATRVRELVEAHGFRVVNITYHLDDRDQVLEFRAAIRALRPANLAALAQTMRGDPSILGYTVTPSGE